jgi:hypothetical protein
VNEPPRCCARGAAGLDRYRGSAVAGLADDEVLRRDVERLVQLGGRRSLGIEVDDEWRDELGSAAAADPTAAELQAKNAKRRGDGQRAYIQMLLANGPLRNGPHRRRCRRHLLALSNPSAYALIADERGWSPDKFERWLGDNLTLLLLRG